MSTTQTVPAIVPTQEEKKLTWGEWLKTPAGMITIAVFVLIIVGGGYYWYSNRGSSGESGESADTSSVKSISPDTSTGGRKTRLNVMKGTRGGGYF